MLKISRHLAFLKYCSTFSCKCFFYKTHIRFLLEYNSHIWIGTPLDFIDQIPWSSCHYYQKAFKRKLSQPQWSIVTLAVVVWFISHHWSTLSNFSRTTCRGFNSHSFIRRNIKIQGLFCFEDFPFIERSARLGFLTILSK